MEYEKVKIRRLIEYKDKITQSQIKNDLEWILEQYNSNYMEIKDYKLKDTITRLKNKYRTLRRIYRELEVKYKESCKKLKSMI